MVLKLAKPVCHTYQQKHSICQGQGKRPCFLTYMHGQLSVSPGSTGKTGWPAPFRPLWEILPIPGFLLPRREKGESSRLYTGPPKMLSTSLQKQPHNWLQNHCSLEDRLSCVWPRAPPLGLAREEGGEPHPEALRLDQYKLKYIKHTHSFVHL